MAVIDNTNLVHVQVSRGILHENFCCMCDNVVMSLESDYVIDYICLTFVGRISCFGSILS